MFVTSSPEKKKVYKTGEIHMFLDCKFKFGCCYLKHNWDSDENLFLSPQVLNLQAELANVQAHISTLQRLSQPPSQCAQSPAQTTINSSSQVPSFTKLASNSNISTHFDQLQVQQASTEMTGFYDPSE